MMPFFKIFLSKVIRQHRMALLIGLVTVTAEAFALVTPTGSFSTSVPIELPPFRGITPTITLEYDSQVGNGSLGVGWSLSGLSQIRRASVTGGLPARNATDQFRLDGIELLPCAGAAAGSPIALSPSCRYAMPAPWVAYTGRIESFRRIAFDPAGGASGQWQVWERDGTRKRYDESPTTGLYLLSEVRDVHGNTVTYHYMRTGFAPNYDYLSEIRYNQTVVTLHWEARPDVVGFATRGGKGWMTRRLLSVDVQVEGQRARAYGLEYAPAPVSKRSTLTKITQYSRLAQLDVSGRPSGPSLPAVNLSYSSPPPTQSWQTSRSSLNSVTAPTTPALRNQYPYDYQAVNLGVEASFLVGDFDGDGRTDSLVYTVIKDPSVWDSSRTTIVSRPVRIQTHTRLATQDMVSGELPFQASSHWNFDEPPFDGRDALVRIWVADVNGDGLDDLVVMSWRPFNPKKNYGALVLTLNTALATGQGTFEWSRANFTDTPWTTNVVWGARNIFPEDSPLCTIGDFNGKGRADFACAFQNSGGKHFLGVAYATSSGTLNAGVTVEEIADDPGVAVPDTTGFVPFETRRIATGDVDGDGLTDIVLLDLNSADVAACAALGDPTIHRPTCTIRYDLLTLISTGNGFDRERTSTPWLREDFLNTVPGHIAAADLNGDGRADVVFFAGPVKGDRFQRLRLLRTAIRQPGTYALSERTVPAALSAAEVHFSLGDVNGDGRTDLMVATPIGPGASGVGCSNLPFSRPVLTVAPADESGNFVLPARWDDCRVSTEVRDDWAEWSPVVGNMSMLQTGDTNGDGYADFVLPVVRKGQPEQLLFTIYDRVAQPGAFPARRWMAADLNADGRGDFIALVPETNSTSVISLIAQPAGGYRSVYFPLGTFTNPALRSWRLADVDGDGRPDLVHVACAPPSRGSGCRLEMQAFMSRGDGTFTREPVSTIPAVANVVGGSPIDFRSLDIDRDGRIDLVQPLLLRDPSSNTNSLAVRTIRSLGGTWQSVASSPIAVQGMPPLPGAVSVFATRMSWKMGDFDGDGRGDLLHINTGNQDARITVLKFDGAAWLGEQAAHTYPATAGWAAWRATTSSAVWRAVDTNGDGVTDLVRLVRSNTGAMVHALESLGPTGWHDQTSPVNITALEGFGGVGWHAVDVTGDGAADFVQFDITSPNTVAVTVLPASGTGYNAVVQINVPNPRGRFVVKPTYQWGDLKGDGRAVLMGVEGLANGSSSSVRVHALAAPLSREAITGIAAGSRTEITYQRATSQVIRPGSQECALPAGLQMPVVTEIIIRDGRTSDRDRTTFGHNCAAWSHLHRTLLGWRETATFRSSAAHRPASSVRSNFENTDECLRRLQSEGVRSAVAGEPWVGPRSARSYLPTGTTPPYRCLLNGIQYTLHGGADSPVAVNRQQTFRYDEFGNVAGVVDDGLGANLVRATLRSFNYAPIPYVVNTPRTEQLHAAADSSGALLRAKIFCYDGDTSFVCDTPPTKGIPSARIDLWEQGTRITKYMHDAYGNLASVLDANSHGTAYFYDPIQHVYPTQIVNALSQTIATLDWDRVLGTMVGSTGRNADPSSYRFDEFGRWAGYTGPDGETVTRLYEPWGDPNSMRVVDVYADGSTDGVWERQYLDGLGRIYKRERKSDLPGEVLGQRTVYADAGPIPYRVSAFSRWKQPGPFRSRAYVSYFYDEAMRPLRTVFPDQKAILAKYFASANRMTRTLTDEIGLVTQTVSDAFGRHVETRGFDGSTILATRFEYDVANQLVVMRDPAVNVTRYTWDRLGRNTGVLDPNLGQRTYAYDKADNLVATTDARNRTISYFHDAVNRVVRKHYPNNSEILWRYDEPTVPNGRGRLTSFIDLTSSGCGADPSARIDYTRGGLPAKVARCVRGHKASLEYSYSAIGRLDSLLYPDGETLNFQYDATGLLSSVPGWLSVSQRDADGRPTQLSLGNGLTRKLQYDVGRQWLRTHRDARGSATVFDVAYNYQPNGRLAGTRSRSNGWNLSVVNDGVGRLRSISGTRTQSWAYDASGNMVFNSARGYYTYPSPGPTACTVGGVPGPCKQPHATQSAGTSQLRYDDNGLLSLETRANGQMRSIDWTFDHLPSVVLDFNGVRTDYEYDAFGNLVVETKAAETIVYLGDFVRKSSVAGATQLLRTGGEPFAEKTASGAKRWYHIDRAGALRAISDQSGNVVARSNYGPYGEPIPFGTGPAPVPYRHADAEILEGSQLQVLGARLYDPVLGRFLGPDTIVPDVHNPGAANRYAFGYNSPLNYIDPSGHQPIGIESRDGGTSSGSGGGIGQGAVHSLGTAPAVPALAPAFLPPPSQPTARPATMGDFLALPWDQQLHLIHQDSNPSLKVTVNESMTYEQLLNLEASNTAAMTWAVFDNVLMPGAFTRAVPAPRATPPSAWFVQGAKQDARFAKLGWKDKLYWDIGQKSLPDKIYAQYSHIADPIARGRAIAQDYGAVHGLFRIYPLEILKRLGTGPTSFFRLVSEPVRNMSPALMTPAAKSTLLLYLESIQAERELNERVLMTPATPP